MKKSLLVSSLATLLALTLVGCNNSGSSSSKGGSSSSASSSAAPSSSSQAPVADVPVVDGKTTFWFTLGDDSAVKTLSSYNSFFMVGSFNSWGTDTAAEFTNLAGTKVYYSQVEDTAIYTADSVFDTTKAGFQLTVGWNSTSGAPAAKLGADYTYKSDYCALYTDGTSHPCFDAPEDGKVELYGATKVTKTRTSTNSDELYEADPASIVHYQTFAKEKAAPVQIDDYKLQFTLNDKDAKDVSKPTWVKNIYATGGFDSWAAKIDADHVLTPTDKGVYTINFGTVYADVTIEFMIVCTTVNAAGEESTSFWANKLQDKNLTWTPGTADDGIGQPDPYTFAAWPADPDAGVDVTINLTVTDFPYAPADDTSVYTGIGVKGDFDGWGTTNAMTLTDGVWSFTYKLVPAKENTEFGFIEYVTAPSDKTTLWKAGTDGANLKVTVAKAALTVAVSGTFAAGFTVAA